MADRREILIDITAPLGAGTRAYPGDPRFEMRTIADPSRGDPARVCSITMGTHTGTHVDAPRHLVGGVAGVDSFPVGAMIGPVLVFETPCGLIGPLDLSRLPGNAPSRILFRGAPVILPEGAAELVARGMVLVGTDGLSVDAMESHDLPAHRILLDAGVVVLEGLDLAKAAPGRYELIALPLLIPGADGAPARAVLRARRRAGPRLVRRGSG